MIPDTKEDPHAIVVVPGLLDFLDGLAENARAGQRHVLNPLIVGLGAGAFARLIREAKLASVPADHASKDSRPADCRNRLRDEGKPYPKSSCSSCNNGGLFGCPHERARC